MITIIELTRMLGETIKELHNSKAGSEEMAASIRKAEGEAALAKQLLKGADIIMRADKNTGRSDRIDSVIG